MIGDPKPVQPPAMEGYCTKKEMLEWLQRCDTPDNAELDLTYMNGQFVLYWRWSYSSGAFGDDFVKFTKPESDLVLREIEHDGE